MYREHCMYTYREELLGKDVTVKEWSSRKIETQNYGITTSPLEEWKAAAGR